MIMKWRSNLVINEDNVFGEQVSTSDDGSTLFSKHAINTVTRKLPVVSHKIPVNSIASAAQH